MFQPDEIKIGVHDFDSVIDGKPLDLLQRKAAGQALSALVAKATSPAVIAVDGPWGCGKTHFLKLWVASHKKSGPDRPEPVYIDALAEDYLDDPMMMLVSAISRCVPSEKASLEQVKKYGLGLTKVAAKLGLAAATGGVAALAGPVIDAITAQAASETEKLMDGIWQREEGRAQAMAKFREALKALAQPHGLVVIVDELDRCRPDYALSILEVMKHAFSVPGVTFVLGVRLEALQSSVRKRYGYDLDAAEYLQKFYTFAVHLPRASKAGERDWRVIFCNSCTELSLDADLTRMAEVLLDLTDNVKPVSPRTARRIALRLALIPDPDSLRYSWRRYLVCSLAIIEACAPVVFKAVVDHTADVEEVMEVFGNRTAVPERSIRSQLKQAWIETYQRVHGRQASEPHLTVRDCLNEYFSLSVYARD